MGDQMTRPEPDVALYEVTVWESDRKEAPHSILTTGRGLAKSVDDATSWAQYHYPEDYEGEVAIIVGRA
jgi:hypothetical protein